jgi:hypothetical protein
MLLFSTDTEESGQWYALSCDQLGTAVRGCIVHAPAPERSPFCSARAVLGSQLWRPDVRSLAVPSSAPPRQRVEWKSVCLFRSFPTAMPVLAFGLWYQ